jgi:hypothetical protein
MAENTIHDSAFPVPNEYKASGMTLQDWFAGQALAGLLANGSDLDFDDLTDIAYLVSRKMMMAKYTEEKYHDWRND